MQIPQINAASFGSITFSALLLAACVGSSSVNAQDGVAIEETDTNPDGQSSQAEATPEADPYADLLSYDFSSAQNPGVRGVWITNVDSEVLNSRESIAEMMDSLAAANINIVYPVVWNKGMTLYPSDVVKEYLGKGQPEESELAKQEGVSASMIERIRKAHRIGIDPVHEGRDPLQEMIIESHRVGIEVIPWFEFGFASSYNIGGGPILEMYPQWAAIDPEGNIVKKNNFEWMNAFHPDVQQFITEMIMEVVNEYDVDGIQGDDRLPALPSLGGYDDYTVNLYKEEFGEAPPKDIKDDQWVQWRADILTDFLKELGNKVKAVDEDLTISMSPSYYSWSKYEYLQDSYTWTNRELIDSLHPQAYRYDFPAYAQIVDNLVENQFTEDQLSILSPGLLVKSGSYLIEPDYLRKAIAYNRKNGIDGEVHFFYEGLRKEDDKLLNILRDEIYLENVRLPYRDSTTSWRRPATIVPVSDARYQGEWVPSPDTSTDYLHHHGGVTGRIVYEAEVPEDGIYDIYMKMPAGNENYTTQAYFVIPNMQIDLSKPKSERGPTPELEEGKDPLQMKEVNQAGIPYEQWVHLGQVDIEGNKKYSALSLLTNEVDSNAQIIAGPAMFVLNRHAMRD